MKIVLVGAGSFVFGPSVLHDALVEHRLDGLDLALVDPQLAVAELMAGLGRRLARDAGIRATVTAHAAASEALDGAAFVICCAAVDLQRRFAADVATIRRLYPDHLITEFGGVQGLAYSLRQIAMIRDLATEMRARCPGAWLLCSANPLPRVCQAAHDLGVPTAGFCSNSLGGYGLVGRVLHGWSESFPWPQATARYDAVMAGVNHFTFTLALRDRETGQDVLPDLLARAEFSPLTADLVARTGCWPANGDGHMHDFLPPRPDDSSRATTSHGDAAERAARLALLRAAGDGSGPWEPLLAHRAWERPVDFAVALSGGPPASCHSLNLVNDGQLPDLPRGVFVETPATVDADGVQPATLRLPAAVAQVSVPVAELHDLVVRAGLSGRADLLDEAVLADPTIVDKAAGRAALEACLAES